MEAEVPSEEGEGLKVRQQHAHKYTQVVVSGDIDKGEPVQAAHRLSGRRG